MTSARAPRDEIVRNGYATIASAYATNLQDELAGKPLDRALLDVLADATRGAGPVLDLGCGPGQVAAYLHARGVSAEGLDLSPHMIEEARKSHPEIPFQVGDMFALPHRDATLAAVVAFYAIVHLQTEELLAPFVEMHRALRPEGLALVAFHVGTEEKHVDELWGCRTSLDFVFHSPDAVGAQLARAGLEVTARLDRAPYPGAEHPSQRTYFLARRPA